MIRISGAFLLRERAAYAPLTSKYWRILITWHKGIRSQISVRLPHASAISIWLAMGYAVLAWAQVGNKPEGQLRE